MSCEVCPLPRPGSVRGQHLIPFAPVALSTGYYLPTNSPYRSLFAQRSDHDQLAIRRQTFAFWPSWAPASLNLVDMAKNGLYYTGDEDEVRCFACPFSYQSWKKGDDPAVLHRNESPHCPALPGSEDGVQQSDDEDCVDFGGEIATRSPPTVQRFLTETNSRRNAKINVSTDSTQISDCSEDCVRQSDNEDCVDFGGDTATISPPTVQRFSPQTNSRRNAKLNVSMDRKQNLDCSNSVSFDKNPMHCRSNRVRSARGSSSGCDSEETDSDDVDGRNSSVCHERLNAAISSASDNRCAENCTSPGHCTKRPELSFGRRKEEKRKVESQVRFQGQTTKEKLKTENERLRKAMTCRKCQRQNSQTLFLPCRHLVTCEQCAEEMDNCIQCHERILGTVRIFMV